MEHHVWVFVACMVFGNVGSIDDGTAIMILMQYGIFDEQRHDQVDVTNTSSFTLFTIMFLTSMLSCSSP